MKLINILKESAMSEIDIIAKESETFNEFVKNVIKDFPQLKKSAELIKWLKDIYLQAK